MDYYQDNTSIAIMEDCVNKNLNDTNKNDLNEVNDSGEDDE